MGDQDRFGDEEIQFVVFFGCI
uniref:Uncharacterized protein n=1 Tax=Arundo donax TaxID=35708 RepID=A0A0A8Y6E3_ARUDO